MKKKIKYYARGRGGNDNRMPCTHACMYVCTGQDRTGEERTEQLEIAYIEKNYIDRSSRNAEYSSGRCVLKCSAIYGYIHIQEYILHSAANWDEADRMIWGRIREKEGREEEKKEERRQQMT